MSRDFIPFKMENEKKITKSAEIMIRTILAHFLPFQKKTLKSIKNPVNETRGMRKNLIVSERLAVPKLRTNKTNQKVTKRRRM